ncbi:MAG: hypothetical protein ACLUVG_23175 [Phocaeicola vulgatus]
MEKFAIWRTGGIRFNPYPLFKMWLKNWNVSTIAKVIFSGNKP